MQVNMTDELTTYPRNCEACKVEFQLLIDMPKAFKFYCNDCQFSMEMDIQNDDVGDKSE